MRKRGLEYHYTFSSLKKYQEIDNKIAISMHCTLTD